MQGVDIEGRRFSRWICSLTEFVECRLTLSVCDPQFFGHYVALWEIVSLVLSIVLGAIILVQVYDGSRDCCKPTLTLGRHDHVRLSAS